jgi:hypothetical protein
MDKESKSKLKNELEQYVPRFEELIYNFDKDTFLSLFKDYDSFIRSISFNEDNKEVISEHLEKMENILVLVTKQKEELREYITIQTTKQNAALKYRRNG